MTAINTTFDSNGMFAKLSDSVGNTGRGFIVFWKSNPTYIDSISGLRNWLRRHGRLEHEHIYKSKGVKEVGYIYG